MIDTWPNPQELQLLLSVNTAIATIRDRKELFATIFEQINPLLPVDDTGLLILDKTGQYWQDWTNIDNYQNHISATQLKELGYDRFQLVDRWMEYTLDHTGIMTVAHFIQAYPEHPFGPVMWEAGLREFIFTPLMYGSKKLGVLFFDSGKEGAYTQAHIPLFKAIASQLAVAVANILANEELLQREQEKAMLLSISQAIAAIHKKEDLLKVIFEKIQPLYGFYGIGLVIISLPSNTVTDWSVLMPEISPSATNQALLEAGLTSLPYRGSAIEHISNEIEKDGRPIIITLHEDSIKQFTDFKETLEIELSHGYKEMWFTQLKAGGKLLGTLNFNSLQANHFQRFDPQFFQAIADLVAIAVANILANEEILEREKEKAILLSISEDIAAVRNKEELLGLIIEKIKPLFHFYDCGILLIDNNGLYYDLSAIHPTIDNSEVNYYLNQTEFYKHGGISYTGSTLEWLISRIEKQKAPVIFDYSADYSTFPDGELLTVLKEAGFQEGLGGVLKTGGKTFGCFTINYHDRQQIKHVQIPLFQNVVDQLSVAVANILANEEILEREREKTALLSISEAIARIHNRKELLRVIYETIQPIYPFDNAGLFITDEEKDVCYELLDRETLPDQIQSQLTKENQLGPWKLSLCNPKSWWMQNDIVISSMEREAQYAIGTPAERQFEVGLQYGLKEMIGGPLFANGKKIGAICFNSRQMDFFAGTSHYLFKSISDQVAVAVANILANEEILEREREKTLLLKVSQAVAKIDNKIDLLRSIDELLQPIFHHSDAGVSVADREKKYLIDYHALYADAIPATPEAQAMNLIAQEQGMVRMPLAGSLIEWAMGQPPMLGKLADLLESGLDAPYLSYEIEHGLTHYLCAPLKVSGNTFGFFNLLFREVYQPDVSRLPLFAQITDVIAVALANILANEEILEREREKTRLLEITELIAQVKADDDLLKLIVEKVKPLFGFEECGLFVVSADGKTHSDWAAIKPAISLSEWSLQSRWNSKVASVSENTPHLGSLIDWAMQEIEKARSPVLFDFKDMVARFPDYPQFVGIDVLGLGFRDSLAANLTVRGKAIGMFCINALQKDFFQPAVFPLFQSVTHTISIAVANILANEEILKREREKSQLLSISNALVMVQSRGQLFRVIYDQIRPLFPFDIAGLLIVDEQEDTHYEFTDDYMLNSADEQRIEAQVGRGPFPYRGSFVEYVINQETPQLLDLKAFEKEFSHPQIPLMLSLGYRQAVAGALCNGGKNFGMLCFSSKKQDFYAAADLPLFTAIAEQLAVVVANILANEEILKREREKSQLLEKIKEEEEIKSVLLSINNNLINIQDRTQLLLRLAEELSKLILIDSLGLKTIHENKQFSERLFFTRKPDNSFEALTGLPAEIENNIDELDRHELEEPLQKPVIYVGEQFECMCRKYLLYRLAREKSGVQSVLLAPIKSREGLKSLLVIKSKKAYAYHTNELLLLDRILPQLAIVMENFISYDNVKQLKNLLEAENVYLQEEVKTLYNFEEIVGKGEALQEALEKTGVVAHTDTTVLLLGETGTGKELFARAIHSLSPRSKKPLIKINCAALPPQLIESELFGHERGAFTGAIDRRIGKFELANGSTLFLDEIGEMPLELQSKLLRAIQEKEIERLGSNKTIKTDVRIIAATNRDLVAEVEAKRFRSDLFFRLHVFPVTLPPLRDRKEDIPLLVAHFIEKFAKKLGKPLRGISTDALQALSTYHYPGNIRELEHILERSAILSKNTLIKEVYLPKNDKKPASNNIEDYRIKSFEENERDYILYVLKKCHGKIYGAGSASELLGLPPTTLASKMKKLGIKKEHVAG